MLIELSIRDFAIIDHISITFSKGLTVLTGETGAGKSIIIDAVHLLAGGRGSVKYVRHNAKKAEISGLFTVNHHLDTITQKCDHYGITFEDDMLVLERTITDQGKSICRINGKIVTLSILREFGHLLIDIHSQHDTQSLMDMTTHIELLDLYDRKNIKSAQKIYTKTYEKLTTLKEQYNKLNENEQQLAHRLDLLTFQLNELKEANLTVDEDIQLEKERTQLHNFEKIFLSVQEAYHALYGDQKGLEWLNIALEALQSISEYDSLIEEKTDILSNAYYNIEELTFELRTFKDGLNYDDKRLNEIEQRINELNRLKKKYGSTVKEMLQYKEKIKAEINHIEHKDTHQEQLIKEIEQLTTRAFKEAEQLHHYRKKAAKSLKEKIMTELSDLYLENATFAVSFMPEQIEERQLHENGFDHVRFLLSTNLGEPLKELETIASGGELSRIMLALKKIFTHHQAVTTVIFDEIDTGVSGRVAQSIAEKMYEIAVNSQVICITHLPQVAAMSDTHLSIKKIEQHNRTKTTISELSESEKINELSKMITGTEMTETAKEHSEQLMKLSKQFKRQIKK